MPLLWGRHGHHARRKAAGWQRPQQLPLPDWRTPQAAWLPVPHQKGHQSISFTVTGPSSKQFWCIWNKLIQIQRRRRGERWSVRDTNLPLSLFQLTSRRRTPFLLSLSFSRITLITYKYFNQQQSINQFYPVFWISIYYRADPDPYFSLSIQADPEQA